MKILTVLGTRPEAIKLAPVILELQRRSTLPIGIDRRVGCGELQSVVCVTAQHRDMLDQILRLFGILPNYDLNVMEENQSPTGVASAILARLEPILRTELPDWVLVQGDTTTVAASSLAAYYAKTKVAHVEAGLRTHNKWQPFPEEVNRRIASVAADLHFAPTRQALQNLLREGVQESQILVTGNTVIDALHWVLGQPLQRSALDRIGLPVASLACGGNGRKVILVTAHRRESFGQPLQDICLALKDIARRFEDEVQIIYPVHPNPQVKDTVYSILTGVPNITLIPPLDYLPMVHLMRRSYMIISDSGGIQEEAPSLGVPVLLLRDVTERPEAVETGAVMVVGTNRSRIVDSAARLLEDSEMRAKMANAVNPYGDGQAASRIVATLLGETVAPFQTK